MGPLQHFTFRAFLRLSPVTLIAACAVVTPDDGGLFAPGEAAGDAGGSAGAGGAGGTGGIQASGSGGSPASAQAIVNADSCQNPFPIALAYGPGRNVFRGTGDTKGDTTPLDTDRTCTEQFGVIIDGPDRVHSIAVNAPDGGYLTARLLRGPGKTEFDAVLYVRTSCEGDVSTACADAFTRGVANARQPINGGELLSIPVPKARASTFFLYVDGVGQGVGGRYELEVSLNKGDCEDPVPLFIEPGSPTRVKLGTEIGINSMKHSCGSGGTLDVIYKVTRAGSGALGASVVSDDPDINLVLMDQTCDKLIADQLERGTCSLGPNAFVGEEAWPDAQRSLFLAAEVSNPGGGPRTIDIEFDPGSAVEPL
jgi:hypothetical protein